MLNVRMIMTRKTLKTRRTSREFKGMHPSLPLFSKMGCHAFYKSVGEGQIIRFWNMALLWQGSIFTEEG